MLRKVNKLNVRLFQISKLRISASAQVQIDPSEKKQRNNKLSIDFTSDDTETWEQWLSNQPANKYQNDIYNQGYTVMNDMINGTQIFKYQTMYHKLLYNEDNVDTDVDRVDFGIHEMSKLDCIENITQIKWPSKYVENLIYSPFYTHAKIMAKYIFGDDMNFDYDMLMYKHPLSDTDTLWHQDDIYEPEFYNNSGDFRSLTFWLSLDPVDISNGCLWYYPIKFNEYEARLHNHKFVNSSYVLQIEDKTKFDQSLLTPVPLQPGQVSVHTGRTPHFSLGNSTDTARRALVINFKPQHIINYKNSKDFQHNRDFCH